MAGVGALLASLLFVPPTRADEQPWTLRCPLTGVTTVVERESPPGQSFAREYLGIVIDNENACVVRERGVVKAMLRQVVVSGTAPATALAPMFESFFPALPGASFSRVSTAQIVGQSGWNTQDYVNTYTYVGQRDLRIGERVRRVALLLHREESRSNHLPHARFVAESTYFFDVETHEMLRFEHRPVSGIPRAVANWQATGD